MIKKKIALKYCGGCNPTFDRVGYVKKIQSAAGKQIDWTTLDDKEWEEILLIQGCSTACLEQYFDLSEHGKVLSISNDDHKPDVIVKNLLSEKKMKIQTKEDYVKKV